MPNPEQFPVKILFQTTEEQKAAIDEWRRKQADLPNRSEAIRRLVEAALAKGRHPQRDK